MNTFAKIALGALMLGSAAATTAAPASAGVDVKVKVGVPVVGIAVDPCLRAPGLRPDYCGYPVYRGPIYVGGVYYHGPAYFRERAGVREVWFRDGWHRWGEGWRDRPLVAHRDRRF
ncbi:MAG TPA: hypothetical protein VGF97_15855 [Rhizomicrobium sp.]|jgi:hypothetical protein